MLVFFKTRFALFYLFIKPYTPLRGRMSVRQINVSSRGSYGLEAEKTWA